MTNQQLGLRLPQVFAEGWDVNGDLIRRRVVAGQRAGICELVVTGAEVRVADGADPRALWDQEILRGSVSQQVDTHAGTIPVRVGDFFSGCGGLGLGVASGIQALGLDFLPMVAADTDRTALDVYERNLRPRLVTDTSLWHAFDFQVAGHNQTARFIGDPQVIDAQFNQLRGSIDLLLGGPPCAGHSHFNNNSRHSDPRNILYLTMPAAAVALDVPMVIIENVPSIIHDKKQVVQTARTLFEKTGYHVDEFIFKALSLGVAQTRKRHILVASRYGVPRLKECVAALETGSNTVRWAMEDLLEGEGRTHFDTAAEMSPVNKERVRFLFENDAYDMPDAIRPPSHQNGNTYKSVYGRLRWDEPAGTITTGFFTPGRGRFIHPARPRALTAHEAARLQGFPDWFEFRMSDDNVLSRKSLSKLIGDAVPPKLGYAALLAALETMPVIRPNEGS